MGFVQDLFGSPDVAAQSSNPAWLDAAGAEIYNKGKTIANQPYTAYSGQRVAPLTNNQQLAVNNAQANLGRFADRYGQITNLLNQTGAQYNQQFTPTNVTARDVGSQDFTQANMNAYMNPYLSSALQPQLNAINQDYATRQNQANARAAGSGNFGGSRQGIMNALLTQQQQEQLNNVRNQGYNTAFNNAANLFQQDQSRNLQAQQSNQAKDVNLGTFNANQAANAFNTNYGIFKDNRDALMNQARGLQDFTTLQRDISTKTNDDLLRTGALGYGYNQGVLDDLYNQFQQKQNYDKDNLSWLASLVNNSASKNSVASPAKEGDNGIGNMIGTGLQVASMFFSDMNLKENIVKIGEENGINIYEFSYKDDPKRYRGVMAQEIEHIPDAVITDESGHKKVDYSKIPVEFEKLI